MAPRSAINAKKRNDTEEWKHYYKLISESNDTCTRSSKNGVLPEDTNSVMENFVFSSHHYFRSSRLC